MGIHTFYVCKKKYNAADNLGTELWDDSNSFPSVSNTVTGNIL